MTDALKVVEQALRKITGDSVGDLESLSLLALTPIQILELYATLEDAGTSAFPVGLIESIETTDDLISFVSTKLSHASR